MQQTGTLRKRSRRTLVKVNGLAQVPYDDSEVDLFNISNIWSFQQNVSKPEIDARVNKAMENFKKGLKRPSGAMYKNSERATRLPMYREEDLEAGHYDPPPPYEEANGVPYHEKNHNRPYLLSNATFNRLRIIIFLGELCLNVPWSWNRKTHRVERWSPFMVMIWKAYWYFTTVQSTFMIIYHSYCLKKLYSSDLESYRGIFGYALIVYWYACHLGYKTCIFLYEDRMRKYINLLQDFNQDYVDKYLVYSDKNMDFGSARLIVKFSIPAAASQIANSLFFFLSMPYQPYYLTSMINPRPWYALIPGTLQDLTVIGQTILTYITISWLQIAHTSTMEFWLREMHKDSDSEYTTDALRTPRVTIPTYRKLQLLCNDFNECMADLCLPTWKFSVAFGFIPCGYLWIRSMNKLFIEEFPGILVYPFGTFNCFTMGFGCLQMAAEMFDIANSFISSWSRTKQKDFRRILLSCPTLKMPSFVFMLFTNARWIVPRRFKVERYYGIKPAGMTLFSDQCPAPNVPPGTYDVGDGFYNPKTGDVRGYDGFLLRHATSSERNWIERNCRKVHETIEHIVPKFLMERIPDSYVECQKRIPLTKKRYH